MLALELHSVRELVVDKREVFGFVAVAALLTGVAPARAAQLWDPNGLPVAGAPGLPFRSAIGLGAESSGNIAGLVQTDKSAAISVATTTTTQLVAGVAGKAIYVTQFDLTNGTGVTENVTFLQGSGSTCTPGQSSLTGAYGTGANLSGLTVGNGLSPVMVLSVASSLCISLSTTAQISGLVSYSQF